MLIAHDNVWAYVLESTAAEFEWLDEYTSCERPARGRLNYEPDSTYHMLDRATRILPAGFLSLLPGAAAEAGVRLDLDDQRGPEPCAAYLDPALCPWTKEPRYDFQWDAVVAGVRAGRGLLKLPTGAGKSNLAAALTRVLPCEWLLAVHRSDLVAQMAERFQKLTGERAGVFQGGWRRGTSNFTVSTFQALHRARRKLPREAGELFDAVQGLIIDEVHCQPAETWYGVTLQMRAARYRFGLSATPLDRAEWENLRTVGAIGPVVYEAPYAELRDRGVLSQSRIVMVPFRHPRLVRLEGQDAPTWNSVYRDLVVRSAGRNELCADLAAAAEKPCMVFVEQVEQGERLMRLLQSRGLSVTFTTGELPVDARRRKLAVLAGGGFDALVTTVIFQEGVDVPELRSVVCAAGGQSAVAALQRIGRGMRVAAGKDAFEVWDIADRGHPWLARHADARRLAYEGAGHEVEVLNADLVDAGRRSRVS
jgi:superfamily II DNA or RNA helicase